ncbi:MAG: ImmA/IrrE family metallo-endopeptidase [Thermomicrobiales bacterium]
MPLEALFHVRYEPILRDWRTDGIAIAPRDMPVSAGNPASIVLDLGLNDHRERLIYAHEIGHALYGHMGPVAYRGMDPWFRRKAERQAWEAAAALLIPWHAMHGDVQRISQVCHVPRILVQLLLDSSVH